MNTKIKHILFVLLGVIISFVIPFLGLYLTNIFDDGSAVSLSLICLPIVGLLTFKSKYKSVGLGIFIGLIPVGILTFTFITLSQLH
jgi:hypothetical protein